MLLDGKRALVTGGVRGIGRRVAEKLLERRAVVGILDINRDALDALVAERREVWGRTCDVTRSGEVAEAVAAFRSERGEIDVLVNCATIAGGGWLGESSEQQSDAVLAVTLKGTMNTCTHALIAMIKQGTGRIINFTSPSWLGVAGADAYTAAKGGVVSLTRGIASRMKLEGHKITCNAIAPIARTRLNQDAAPMWDALYKAGVIDRQLYEDSVNPASPEEIPPIVCYLATDQAENINGRVFGATRGRIALYSDPQEIRGIYKDGIWTLEELVKLMPRTLARGL